ncbi:MAG: 2-phosphosulfolactate phosphatase [Candidatus Kapaibacterium sp.]
MLLDVVFTPDSLPDISSDRDIVVVIDVLRASTTMCAMLHHGARRIRIASSVDHALQLHAASQSVGAGYRTLLAGERAGLPPEGFDMGNSPLDAREERMKDAVVTYATTNGTRMLHRTRSARMQLVGCFANLSALMNAVVASTSANVKNARIILCCSGNNGGFSLEDSFFAGSFLSRYIARGFGQDLTNAAEAALCIVSSHNHSLVVGSEGSRHGRVLASLGLGQDVGACFTEDVYPVVPVCEDMVVRRL